ncbi:Do family serine endopeptidase [Natronoflexus pectinivorans]|uniref:Do/DeqQ family serine protease n=1 Tax=Natronoflexus pectinivorans TaxID=682526 RepID=A0A4R2GJC0_9BACT|nr:Do family serine endopeptidase [Natronoflexus pectinivorans]TCO08760.1 Do/DeqQ family serine protease [Natronoflexus pectinivorans]
MKTRKLISTFAIAFLGALAGVFIYSQFFSAEPRIIEIPVKTNHSGTNSMFTSLPAGSTSAQYPNLTYAAEKSVHAVVHVQTKGRSSGSGAPSSGHPLFDFFFGPRGFGQPQPQQPVMGSGSGVIISQDGYIVTNNHVVDRADEIEITLNDNRSYKAILVGADPTTDIALLKIDETDLPYLIYGNSDALSIGEWVLAVGNPFNLTSTVTAGIVSAKSRSIQILGQMSIEAFIQTDAAVNPGNSGGALVNTRGELIGINTAIASRTGSFTGYSFAVPVSIVEKVVDDLLEFGAVQRGLLGVSIREMNNELARELGMDRVRGVYVAEAMEGGGAKAAGIKSRDVILSVNGDAVNSVPQLQERVSRFRPGDNVQIEVLRDGKRKPFTVTLRNIHGNTDLVQNVDKMSLLGASFEPLSDAERQRLRIRNGIKVTEVGSGKFRDAGIREGYVIIQANRVPVNSEDDLRKVVDVASDALFLSGVYQNGRTAFYAINLQE